MKLLLIFLFCILFSLSSYAQKTKPYESVVIKQVDVDENKGKVDKTLLFPTSSSAELSGDMIQYLDKIFEYLKNNPNSSLRIVGHSDDQGTFDQNDKRARERATNIADYLAKKGIPMFRLLANGKGAIEPVASNKTEEGRQKNRRVEIKIVTHDDLQPKARKFENSSQIKKTTLKEHVDISFGFPSSESTKLTDEIKEYLDKVYLFMTENHYSRLHITGHSDDQGTFEQNDERARLRAQNTADYLAEKGIKRSRLFANGKSSIEPIASNKTEAGRQKNRRVEIRIATLVYDIRK
ncbi:OmpA family protein [Bacteroidota bacterium]